MGRLLEAIGKYAEIPYYIAQTDTSVYCVEELCFTLCRNVFLLDRGLMDQRLVKWLETECGLKDLAKRLYPLVSGNASPSVFVGEILEYARFGTEKLRRETEDVLRLSADMDASVRRKNFADYLVEHERFAQAVIEYGKVLEEISGMNHVVRSQLFHNKGVALSRLFFFEEAAQAFLAAYEENPENEEAAFSYLTALRMSLSEPDYIAFIAGNPEWHEQSLEVEKRVEAARAQYEASEKYRELSELFKRRDAAYYETISGKLAQMQKKYREMVAQP